MLGDDRRIDNIDVNVLVDVNRCWMKDEVTLDGDPRSLYVDVRRRWGVHDDDDGGGCCVGSCIVVIDADGDDADGDDDEGRDRLMACVL